jgi:hypothetical protein
MNLTLATLPFDAILVPQGQEYQAVCRGLQRIEGNKPLVIAIPLGTKATREFLQQNSIVPLWQQGKPRLLLMGLAGGLSPQHRVGDVVIYRECLYAKDRDSYISQQCDRNLTALLQENLGNKAMLVSGLTSDRLIYTAREKQLLDSLYPASVVDMEGFSLLEFLASNDIYAGVAATIVRIISDDCYEDIPDFTISFTENGGINPLLLAVALLKQPFIAQKTIRNSLQALSILSRVTEEIFSREIS